jgi:S1-C subfamily serine protease
MTRNWFYLSGNRQLGPLTIQELAKIASQGRIGRSTRVREGANGAWVAASNVAGIFPAAVAATPPPLTAPVSTSDCLAPAQLKTSQGNGLPVFAVVALAVAVIGVLALVVVVLMNQSGWNVPNAVASKQAQNDARKSQEAGGADKSDIVPVSEAPINAPERTEKKSGEDTAGRGDLPTAMGVLPFSKNGAATRSRTAEIAQRAKLGVVQVTVKTYSGVSKGTGFVVASVGKRHLVVTNKHVIEEEGLRGVGNFKYAGECEITYATGDSASGKLAALAKDSEIDAAMLLVESDELRTLGPVAKFEAIGAGDDVVAVGNPGIPGTHITLNQSLTKGIISGKRGDLFVQTDAAINHGNSGGPLLNERGEIVGINTYSFSGVGAPGIGLAIRADLVLDKNAWRFSIDVSDLMRVAGK